MTSRRSRTRTRLIFSSLVTMSPSTAATAYPVVSSTPISQGLTSHNINSLSYLMSFFERLSNEGSSFDKRRRRIHFLKCSLNLFLEIPLSNCFSFIPGFLLPLFVFPILFFYFIFERLYCFGCRVPFTHVLTARPSPLWASTHVIVTLLTLETSKVSS